MSDISLLDRVNREVYDWDADGETLFYALIERDENGIDLLKDLGVKDVDGYLEGYCDEDSIDISIAVWDSGLSEWFENGQFTKKESPYK